MAVVKYIGFTHTDVGYLIVAGSTYREMIERLYELASCDYHTIEAWHVCEHGNTTLIPAEEFESDFAEYAEARFALDVAVDALDEVDADPLKSEGSSPNEFSDEFRTVNFLEAGKLLCQ